MSESTSSIAIGRPTRSTRGATATASASKTTATTSTKPRGGASAKKNGVGTAGKKTKGKGKKGQVYCVCREKDYGTPMICCGACREWYHFSCLGLVPEDAEDIEVYICGPCSLDTGLRTARDWEGPEGLEEVDEATLAERAEELKSTRTYEPEPEPTQAPPPPESESEGGDSSSDEYDGKDDVRRPAVKRRVRRMESSDEDEDISDEGEEDGQPKAKRSRLWRGSRPTKARSTESPGPGQSFSSKLKRKQSVVEGNPPAKKNKTFGGPNDDPTRKYCLGRLQEIFSNIFLTFPYFPPEDSVKIEDEDVDRSGPNAARSIPEGGFTKTTAELTDEEKAQLEGKAKAYATQVEAAAFEAHAEPDKAGVLSAAGKYKERFRMLDFNLKKPDRAVLHKRIVSSVIPPVALAHMSSTDLASEAEKESIKQAEQQALEHSILQKVVAPRAKVTHKGLQDIENIDGRPGTRDVDLDKEIEEEERRERERTARMRMRSATLTSGSGSVPPESPIVADHPSSVTWGGPPPVPFHLQQSPISPTVTDRPPLFAQTQSELLTPTNGQVEGELNLADLINIDDDGHDSAMVVDASPAPAGVNSNAEDGPEALTAGVPQSPVVSQSARPTGISPFAVNTSQPDLTIRPSFDLNSVWSAPGSSPKKQEDNEESIGGPDETEDPAEPPPDLDKGVQLKDPFVDDDILGGAAADDKDFDMFLEADPDADGLEGRSASANPPPDVPAKEPSFDELPQVWLGSLSMPLDSNTPTDIPVLARQVGGRPLEDDSPLWKTLFPSVQLRIDGRVPIDKSAQFLLQMRMNSSKELVAVAFSPPGEQQAGPFKLLIDYLLGKNRHGLVFPWGPKPKEYHPGRELYIIPLRSSEPLPDYVELLDSLRLPKVRTEDYLIGVWILNKGKLVAPPAPTPPPLTPTLPTATPGLASIISQLQQTITIPSFGVPPPPPSISPPSMPPIAPPPLPPPTSGSPVNPAMLAAEVASLTPDQIQRMVQSLQQVGPGQIPPPIPQQSPPPIPPPSNGHGPLLNWMNGPPPPGPPGTYPPFPPNVIQHPPPGPGPSPPPLHPHQPPYPPGPQLPHRPPYPGGPGSPYENHDQFDGPGYERSRYERGHGPAPRGGRGRSESGGWRGRGGGRERDRGRDRGDRPRDSGWPKRGGRGGGPGWGERSRT